jgi:hypothetical protein
VAGIIAVGILMVGVGGFMMTRDSETTPGGTASAPGRETTTRATSEHASAPPTDAAKTPSTAAAAEPPKPGPDAPSSAGGSEPATPAPEASGPIPTTLGQQPKPKVEALDPPTTWYAELVVNCEPACTLVLIQGGPAVNPSVPKQLPPGAYIVTVQQAGGVQSQSPLLRAATRTTLTFDGKLAVPPPTAPLGGDSSKPKCTGFLRAGCK